MGIIIIYVQVVIELNSERDFNNNNNILSRFQLSNALNQLSTIYLQYSHLQQVILFPSIRGVFRG
jgi:hypothetical protein